MTEDEFVQLLLAGQAMDQAGPPSPFTQLTPRPTAPMSAYEPGPWGPNPEASRAGYLNPEDYLAAQGEIRGESAFPQDPLRPAYQGAADIGASFLAPPVASGTQLVNDPSIKNATQFGADAVMAASPLASANQTAMRLLGVTGGGTAAAVANDIFNTPAMAARRKKGGRQTQQQSEPPPPIEKAVGPTNEAGRVIAEDPEIQQIDNQIDFYNRVLQDSTKPKSTRDGAARQLEVLNQSRSKAVGKLTEGMQPFNKAYPTLSGMMPFIQLGAGAGAGFLTKGLGDTLHWAVKRPWRNAVTQGEEALASGDLGKAINKARGAEYYQNSFAPKEDSDGAIGRILRNAAPTLAGATAGAELSMLPDRYNLNNAPTDSEAHKISKANLENPWNTLGVGAVMGGLGAATGQHLTPTMRTSYPLGRSKAFVDSVKTNEKYDIDALAERRINEARQSGLLKSYLPRQLRSIDWQNPAVPYAKREAVIKHMMSHPKKPPGAVHFNSEMGRYVDAKGKLLKFGE